MKYSDLKNLTRTAYNNSPHNKAGVFEPPLGFIKRFKMSTPLSEADLDKAFDVYKASAFDDIVAYNPDRPLVRVYYPDFSTTIQEGLEKANVCQISMLVTNGLSEVTQTNQNSNGAFTSTTDTNTRIITTDQIDTDTEDALNDIKYSKWRVITKDGKTDIIIGDVSVISAKTANGIALSALTFLGLTEKDLTFLGKDKIVDLINTTFTNTNKTFRGTWEANNIDEVNDVDNIFATTGILLTNGILAKPDNTKAGNTIAVVIPSENDFLIEELLWDGTIWRFITNNNQEQADKSELQEQIDNLESDKAEDADVVKNVDPKALAYREATEDVQLIMLKQLIDELAKRDVEIKSNKDKLDPLPQDITDLGSKLVENRGGTITDIAAMAKDPADQDADVRLMTAARITQLIAECLAAAAVDATTKANAVQVAANAYTDAQIAAIPPVKNPLLGDYETLGKLHISSGNNIDIDFTKPNDYYAITDEATKRSVKMSFDKNVNMEFSIVAGVAFLGNILFNKDTKKISNNNGDHAVTIYRRKEI